MDKEKIQQRIKRINTLLYWYEELRLYFYASYIKSIFEDETYKFYEERIRILNIEKSSLLSFKYAF